MVQLHHLDVSIAMTHRRPRQSLSRRRRQKKGGPVVRLRRAPARAGLWRGLGLPGHEHSPPALLDAIAPSLAPKDDAPETTASRGRAMQQEVCRAGRRNSHNCLCREKIKLWLFVRTGANGVQNAFP